MLPVVDKPLIQYAVEEARAAGIEQFCLVTGRGKTALVEHFDIAYELEATLKRARQAQGIAGAARAPPAARRDHHGAPAGAARPRPRHLVRARLHRRGPVRHPAARRPGAGRRALHEAARRRLCRDRRLRGGGDRGAARTDQPLRHPRDRQRRRQAGGSARAGGKAEARGGAVEPLDHRPLRAAAGGRSSISRAWNAAPAARCS